MIGRTLSHYRILEPISHGGMGVRYRAHDERLHRDVALKVVPETLLGVPGAREALRTEARALSRINHPNVETVLDFDSSEGIDFLVTEFVAGESLEQLLEGGALDANEQASIAGEIARALDHAHRSGVIHGDVKPANVMLTPEGRVKLVDFGLARLLSERGSALDLESEGNPDALRGTLPYLSPEQILGGRARSSSDIYSLGVVLYEMATGLRPFQSHLATVLMMQIARGDPPREPLRSARVSSAMQRVIRGCMARRPKDRFGSAAEVARALESIEPLATPHRTTIAAAVAGLLLVLAASAVLLGWVHLPGVSPSAAGHVPESRAWVLVAQFEGPPEDPGLAVTARDLVSAALDQSRVVATVPPDQIQLALRMAGKPADARVDAALAKELAYRSAVRTVLEGSIGRIGHTYSVVLRVVDAESLKVLVTERAVAANEDELIPAIGHMVGRLRARLGEHRAAIAAVRTARPASTPSFEAYRLYVRGNALHAAGAAREAVPVFREALRLDPEFALAWEALGNAFRDDGDLDSARGAIDEALRHPRRLTRGQQLEAGALRHLIDEEPEQALAAYDQLLEIDPSNREAVGGRLVALYGLGRYEEVLQESESLRYPFGKSQAALSNDIGNLLRVGRIDEARALSPLIAGRLPNARHRIAIEIAEQDWSAVERSSDSLVALPGAPSALLVDALGVLASARAARGAFREAEATYARGEELARDKGGGRLLPWQLLARARLMLTVASRGATPVPPDAWDLDRTAATLITEGLRAAIAGDAHAARKFLDAARADPRAEWPRHGASPEVLEARIALLEGRAEDAARILRPLAAQRREIGDEIMYRIGMSYVRWSLADAFEAMGRPDSAVAVLERVTQDPGPWLEEIHTRGILLPFAHRRLALLDARLGRVADAMRHWETFRGTVRTPDPELRPMIDETAATIRKVEEESPSAAAW